MWINKNIPNDEKYRTRVLTSDEYADILVEEKPENKRTLEELFKELSELKDYGK